MKKGVLIGLLVLVAVALIGSVVYAQNPTPPVPQPGSGYGPGMMGGRGGMPGGGMRGGGMMYGQVSPQDAPARPGWTGYSGAMHDLMASAYAAKLGMSVEDLNKALAAGKSMGQVAQEKGLSAEQFAKIMDEAHDQALAEAVKKGLITQEQANWMEQRQEQMGARQFENCWGTAPNGQPSTPNGFMPRRGGMRGPQTAPTAPPAPKS